MLTTSVKPSIYLFAVLVVLYVCALLFGWFDSFPGYDIFMHLLGGAWAATLFFFLSRGYIGHEMYAHGVERLKLASLAMWFGTYVGVWWEFLEFLLGPYFAGFAQSSVRDTLGDLLMDMLGAAAYACVALFLFPYLKKKFSQ